MEDITIRNGTIVSPLGSIRGSLTMCGEKITYIGDDTFAPRARSEIDADGLLVLPGAIDPHVHLGNDMEEKFRERCRTESMSAVLGGVTTIMTSARFGDALGKRLEVYKRAREIASSQSLVDFRFNAFILNENHLDEIEELMDAGITTFKLLMCYTQEQAACIGLQAIDWGFVYKVMEKVGKLGPPAIVQIHCEEPMIVSVLRQRLESLGRQDIAAWTESRPSVCEMMHVHSAALLAQETGALLYIVHTSAKESVDAIADFKRRGTKIYGETCPHYLLLNRENANGLLAKVSPPLRDDSDQARLWQGLREGAIDTVGSDHTALLRKEKEPGGLWKAYPGFGSIGVMLSLLASEGVSKGKLTWETLARITSENPAKIFSIFPQKGILSPGSDADIVVLDPEKEWTIDARALLSRTDFSVYEGWKVHGKVVKTFVRGKLVADLGRVVVLEPSGKYVFPSR